MAFMKSCTDVTIDAATAVLSAKCFVPGSKDSVSSTLNLNDYFSNHDGQFLLGIKEGGFVSTSSGISLSLVDYSTATCILSAKLKDLSGNQKDAKMNLNDFVGNYNGKLGIFKDAFFITCGNIRLEGTVLKASCKNKANQMVDSELDLNPLIGNINGAFKWGKSNFQASASNIKLLNTIYLTANLKNEFGVDTYATLNLVSYIANLDGALAGLKSVDLKLSDAELKPMIQSMVAKFPRGEFETSVSTDNKIQYLYFNANAGEDDNLLFSVASGEVSASIFHIAQETGRPIENVRVDVLQAKAGAQFGSYVGVDAGVYLLNASASIFDAKLGFGVSTGAGIQDDSLTIKAAGVGFTVGRKIGISVFDNEFAIDFGRCNVM